MISLRVPPIPPRFMKTLLFSLSAAVMSMTATTDVYALDLVQSYQLALQNDAKYQASRAETAASREAVPQARALLLPNVSINAAASRNQTDSETPGVGTTTVNNSYYYPSSNYALVLRQPLYRKYSFAQYRQAQSQVVTAEALLDNSLQDLLLRLCGAYFNALLARDQVDLALSQKEAYGAQLQGAKRMFSTGSGTRTDIDDAQARYDLSLAQEVEALQNIGHTRRQLQAITSQPVGDLAMLNPARMELAFPVPADPEEWAMRGREINAELRALRATIETAKQDIEKAKAGHTPTVDLVVQRSRSMSENNVSINSTYATSQIGVQVTIPIYSGGGVVSAQRQALANVEKFSQLYEARRNEVDVQVRQEFESVVQGVSKVKALEQAERSTTLAVTSNQKGLQAGTRTQVDVLNALQLRTTAQRDLAQARYQYLMARVRLLGLVGSLNEDEIAVVNSWLAVPTVPTSRPPVLQVGALQK